MKNIWIIVFLGYLIPIGCSKKEVEIRGMVYGEEDHKPLLGAVITHCNTGKSVITDKDGSFTIRVEEGDSLKVSYVGLISRPSPVTCSDSVSWKVTLKDYGPIVEPILQRSYGTHDGGFLTVTNHFESGNPVDSIILSVRNETDETVMFGRDYELEIKQDGQWKPMPYNREFEEGECDQVISMVGYSYSPHSESDNTNYTQPFSNKFGKGIYRMMKTFFVGNTNISDTVYVEFEIQ